MTAVMARTRMFPTAVAPLLGAPFEARPHAPWGVSFNTTGSGPV